MANTKPPKLLPKVTYSPPRDGGLGGGRGDFTFMDKGNSYAANPDYSSLYGGGGGMPPTQAPPQNPPDPPVTPPVMGPGLGAMDWNMVNQVQAAAGIAPAVLTGFGGVSYQPRNTQEVPGWMTGAAPDFATGRAREVAGGAPQYIQDAFENYYRQNPTGADVSYPNREGGTADGAIIYRGGAGTVGGGVPSTGGTEAGRSSASPEMAGPANDQVAQQWQATLNKNQNLTEKAKQEGNSKELARLQAEWDRIAPKAAKYGISAERLVNSYMQPGNPAAEPTLDRALGRAIADDVWAKAMTAANAWTGDPAADNKMWAEHWHAMNKGGRDPLEGHPAAIQQIQAEMERIRMENQQESSAQYQQWLNNQ